jgi:hypothetical protein
MKAQSLSMNVIIIAALALLVLVIMSVLFLTSVGDTILGMKDCEKLGSKCMASAGECTSAGFTVHPDPKMVCYNAQKKIDRTRVCCSPIAKLPA